VEIDLRRTLGREVRIANDADCFAVSEAVDGAGVGHHVVVAVILGSGVGAGIAFARDYKEHASIDLAPSEPLRPAEIVERMRQGDRLAKLVWNRYIDRVARGLSVVVNTLDPDILVLGGMANIDELYDELPPRLSEETFSPCFCTPIARAAHGDSSGVRGAAWLWR
jgi:fructokinase